MTDPITLEFDGGSRGNPGPAGIGVVLRSKDGTELVTLGRFIGRATNNVAEYRALITALQKAMELGAKRVAIRGDSELVVKQIKGEYRVKNEGLRELYEEARTLLAQFDHATIDHNYRHKNALADKLANLAMDRRADVTEVNGGGGGRGGLAARRAVPRRPQVRRPLRLRPLRLFRKDRPPFVAPSAPAQAVHLPVRQPDGVARLSRHAAQYPLA